MRRRPMSASPSGSNYRPVHSPRRTGGRASVWSNAAALVGLAAVYYAAANLGLSMAFVAEQVTVVWPPTGIAIAALLGLGLRFWPAVAVGAFVANVTTGAPAAAAAGIAAGNTLEAVLPAWALRRYFDFNPRLE